MRFVIDATTLLLPGAGIKTYVHGWLRALKAQAGHDVIEAYPFLNDLPELDHRRSLAGRAGTLARLVFENVANIRHNRLLDMVLSDANLFHASQHNANPPRRIAVTATVFDATCWLFPETHTPANVAATKLYAERVLRRADGLIAISENTRKDAIDILGIPAERIEVIYPGVAEEFFHVTPDAVSAAKRRYGLSRPYLLFVGCIEPRKNVGRILDAYKTLRFSTGELELILAGPVGWNAGDLLQRSHQTPGVRLLGYVPETLLPGLARGAEILVYPSLYEGFGLPVAQALAAGVPVVTSNRSCLPEVAGGGALLIDPNSVEQLREAIETLMQSDSLRIRLGEAGRTRAEMYRWNLCAARSLRFFHTFQQTHTGSNLSV